jgi:hypothetical protein
MVMSLGGKVDAKLFLGRERGSVFTDGENVHEYFP